MATIDLFVPAHSNPLAPYSVRRRRCEGGEVSSSVEGGERYWPGTVIVMSRRWRWIRIVNAPSGLGGQLAGADLLLPEDVGKDFPPRRKVWQLILKSLNLPATRLVPDLDANHWTAEEKIALEMRRPALRDAPLPRRRASRWDLRIAYNENLFVRKADERRDNDGLPLEESAPLPDQGIEDRGD